MKNYLLQGLLKDFRKTFEVKFFFKVILLGKKKFTGKKKNLLGSKKILLRNQKKPLGKTPF